MDRARSPIPFPLLVAALSLCTACAAPPPPWRTVERVDPNTQIDLSGRWNDTDADIVTEEMLKDCFAKPWATRFKADNGKVPVVRLYPIRNRSHEHIQTRYFTKQVESELINSGMVQVVADLEEAQDNRLERRDQAEHASDETVKSQGQETGSDYILNGWIVTEQDALDGQKVKAYVITMELTDTKTNVKTWMKVHKIKKVVNQEASEW